MQLTWRKTLVRIVAVGALLGSFGMVCQAAPGFLRSPLVVTMSGTLQPFHEQESHGLNTLTVTIDDKQKWLFNVNRGQSRRYGHRYGPRCDAPQRDLSAGTLHQGFDG